MLPDREYLSLARPRHYRDRPRSRAIYSYL